ncbi:MAG: hypothetical protein H6867_04825 [Rhodospirillales bacterium]|nr:hypothetical protein [Rhodospirillales bacterium]MCB9994825.1 hypothetical protein [Rhodospirillales bacterium]
MPENRIKTALAGPNHSPAPIVGYEYDDDQGAALGQVLAVEASEDQSAVFGYNEVRIQAEVDTHYWIGDDPALNSGQDQMDILFAGVVYHEVVDPTHKMTFVSADGVSTGNLFIRPVQRLTE